MCRPSTRSARPSSVASAFRRPPPSFTARAYSTPPNCVRSLPVRRLRAKSKLPMPTAATTMIAMIMDICVVLKADRSMMPPFTAPLPAPDGTALAVGLYEPAPLLRFFDYFFHLADFLLNFPGYFFADAFAFQVGIVRQLAHLLFNRALHFVNLPCDFVFSAWLHLLTFLN